MSRDKKSKKKLENLLDWLIAMVKKLTILLKAIKALFEVVKLLATNKVLRAIWVYILWIMMAIFPNSDSFLN